MARYIHSSTQHQSCMWEQILEWFHAVAAGPAILSCQHVRGVQCGNDLVARRAALFVYLERDAVVAVAFCGIVLQHGYPGDPSERFRVRNVIAAVCFSAAAERSAERRVGRESVWT